jgi:hypothetical protein
MCGHQSYVTDLYGHLTMPACCPCDLKGSPGFGPDRGAGIPDRISAHLELVKAKYARDLFIPFQINHGDGIAGLVRRPAVAFDVVRSFRRELGNETGCRFATVFARIIARTANIRQQGGDVFTMENAAMRRLKRQNRFGQWHIFHDARDTGLSRLTDLCQGMISCQGIIS